MSKKLFVLFSAIFSILFFGCEEYDAFDYEEEFNSSFLRYLGIDSIHPDQDWGFGGQSTRAVIKEDMVNYPSEFAPEEISEEEREYVTSWFSSHPGFSKSSINWSNFFVQHVSGKGEELGIWHKYDQNREIKNWDEEFSDNFILDYLRMGNGEHVYDYNSTMGEKTVYLKNSSTSDFSVRLTWNNLESHLYKMAKLETGYYVGFTAWGTKEDNGIKEFGAQRKEYCDDWIIKIVPGEGEIEDRTKRVIVEDLISSITYEHLPGISDWDYNDAVFDVSIEEDSTTITLLAAMGTQPLYVAGKEIHQMFGVLPQIIVDTRINRFKPVSFKIKTRTKNINEIPVLVDNGSKIYDLYADRGKAPAKICVGTDYDWCDERLDIRSKYPKFREWVSSRKYDNNEWYRK